MGELHILKNVVIAVTLLSTVIIVANAQGQGNDTEAGTNTTMEDDANATTTTPYTYTASVNGSNLLDDLQPFLKAHKSLIREGVIVYFGISLKHVVSLDEHDQIIKINMRVTMTWEDPFFRWNPSDYEGVDEVLVLAESTWQPDVVLYNCVEEEYKTQIEQPVIVINHMGKVTYSYPISTEALCLVDVTFFPLDQQTCPLEIGSWSYTKRHIELRLAQNSNNTDGYLKNSAWDLRSFISYRTDIKYDCCPEEYTVLYYKITLRRRWSLYGAYLILPNFIMNVLCIVQFLLPCDSNERVGLGINLYLSLLVYLILIEAILPSTEKFPLFVVYIFTTLIEVTVAEISTIYVLYLHNKGIHDNQTEVKPWMRKYILHGIAKFVCMHKFIISEVVKERLKAKKSDLDEDNVNENATTGMEQVDDTVRHRASVPADEMGRQHATLTGKALGEIDRRVTIIHKSDLETNRGFLLGNVLKLCEKYEERVSDEQRALVIRQEWQQLAMVVDRFMFFLFLVFNIMLWSILAILLVDFNLSLKDYPPIPEDVWTGNE